MGAGLPTAARVPSGMQWIWTRMRNIRAHLVIDHGAKDDVGGGISQAGHHLGHAVHLLRCEIMVRCTIVIRQAVLEDSANRVPAIRPFGTTCTAAGLCHMVCTPSGLYS